MPLPRWFPFAAFSLTLLVVVFLMTWRLNVLPIQNWDESIHAEVSREMVGSENWLDLSYRDGEYFRKPPLKFWLTSAAFAAFGESVWAIRGWSALAGIATSLLLGLWAWQLWKNRWLALLTVLVFASGRFVFFHAFRTGETDGLLVFFVTLALYWYWRSKTDSRWLVAVGLAAGLAVMAKSAGGLLPILIMASDAIASRSWPYRWRDVLLAAGVFLLIAAPWHAVELVRHGRQFWNDYVGLHVLERATEQLHNQGVGTFWYVSIFFKRFFPWSLWIPFALVWAWRQARRDRGSPLRLLLLWFAVTFVFFTLVRTKFDWYLLPLYPAAALLLTPWIARLINQPSRTVAAGHALSLAAYFFLLPDAVHPASVLRWTVPFTYLTGWSINAANATAIGIVVILAFFLLTNKGRASAITGGLVLTHLLIIGVGWSLLTIRAERTNSPLPQLASSVESTSPTRLYVKGVDLLHYPAAYWYFRGIPGVTLVDLEKQFEPFAFQPTDALIVRDPSPLPLGDWEEVKRIDDFRVLQPATRPQLRNPVP